LTWRNRPPLLETPTSLGIKELGAPALLTERASAPAPSAAGDRIERLAF